MSKRTRLGAWGRQLKQNNDCLDDPVRNDSTNMNPEEKYRRRRHYYNERIMENRNSREEYPNRRRRGYRNNNKVELEMDQRNKNTQVCMPYDAYGIDTYGESYVPINVVKDDINDLCIPFVASVKIPVGFILPPSICATKSMNIDTSTLAVNTLTQYYATSDSQCAEINTNTSFKMQVAVLNGALYYNFVLGNFTPAKPVQDSRLQVYTKFSASDVIYVDKIVGYSPFGYQPPTSYTINLLEGKESLTLLDGRCIYKQDNEEEFECLLSNPDITKVLNYPYQVMITNNILDATQA